MARRSTSMRIQGEERNLGPTKRKLDTEGTPNSERVICESQAPSSSSKRQKTANSQCAQSGPIQKESKSRGLKDNMHGPVFQKDILTLFLCRGCNGDSDFGMTTEDSEFGKFDDIVVVDITDGKCKFRCFQLKHQLEDIQNPNENTKKKITKGLLQCEKNAKDKMFCLEKYYNSFVEITEKIDKGKLSRFPFKNDLSQIEGELECVIILTNWEFHDNAKDSFEKVDTLEKDILLKLEEFKPAEAYKLKVDSTIWKEVNSRFSSENGYQDAFLEKFRFITGCPDASQITNLISKEMDKLCKLPSDTNISQLSQEVLKWLASSKVTVWDKAMCMETIREVSDSTIRIYIHGLTNSKLAVDPTFWREYDWLLCGEISKFLESDVHQVLILVDSDLTSCRIHVAQAFNQLKQVARDDILKYTSNFGHVYLRFEEYEEHKYYFQRERKRNDERKRKRNDERKRKRYDEKGCNLLMIECKYDEMSACQTLLDSLTSLNKLLKVICVTETTANGQLDLTSSPKRRKLDLTLKIGCTIGFDPKAYIDRFLDPVHIAAEIQKKFEPKQGSCFKISETDLVVVSEIESDFDAFCHEESRKNIHWLKRVEPNSFVWRKSRGPVSELFQYRLRGNEGFETVSEDDIKSNAKVNIIVGDAGTGKSSLLASLSEKLAKFQPNLWIIRFNLIDYSSELLEKWDEIKKNKLTSVGGFLLKLMKHNKTKPLDSYLAYKDLISYIKILNEKQSEEAQLPLALFFDGFDEISSGNMNTIFDFLSALARTNVKSIFITTRPFKQHAFETHLGTFAYTLKIFSKNEIPRCLTLHWEKLFKDNHPGLCVNLERLQKFVEETVANFSARLKKGTNFIGIPLHLQLIAEVLEKKCCEFTSSDQGRLDFTEENFHIFDLCKQFVNKKYEIWEASKETEGGSIGCEHIYHTHKILAAGAVFPSDTSEMLQKLVPDGQVVDQNNIHDYGFVTNARNNRPRFVHRIFAEYFAATLLGQILLKHPKSNTFYAFLAEHFLSDDIYANVCTFLSVWLIKNYGGDIPENFNKLHSILPTMCRVSMDIQKFVEKQTIIASVLHCMKHSSDKKNTPADELEDDELADELEREEFKKQLGSGIAKTTVLHDLAAGQNLSQCKLLMQSLESTAKAFLELIDQDAEDYRSVLKLLAISVIYFDETTKTQFMDWEDHQGKTALHHAIEHNQPEVVEYLLTINPISKDMNGDGNTALHIAAKQANISVVSMITDSVDPGRRTSFINQTNKIKQNALHIALLSRNYEIVDYLLANQADVYQKDINGNSALHVAAIKGSPVVLKRLVKVGELRKINELRNSKGEHLLHVALLKANYRVLQYLLDNGADAAQADSAGNTALHLASIRGSTGVLKNIVMSIAIEDRTTFINKKNRKGQTALHIALLCRNYDIIDYLLANHADVLQTNFAGNSVLHTAAAKGPIDILEKLIKSSDSHMQDFINMQNKEGLSALHIAFSANNFKAVDWLLKNGADGLTKNQDGNSILHMAIKNENLDVIKKLIECMDLGVKNEFVNLKNTKGHNALSIAIWEESEDIIDYLLKTGASIADQDNCGNSIVHLIATKGNITLLQKLINYADSSGNTLDLNLKNQMGHSALHIALLDGKKEIFECLLKNGADVEQKDVNANTTLHFAAKRGLVGALRLLIESKKISSLNLGNKAGLTPLHFGLLERNYEVVEYLLKNNADPTQISKDGNTALHIAAQNGDTDGVRLLMNFFNSSKMSKLDFINSRNEKGLSALKIAHVQQNQKIVSYLLSNGATNLEKKRNETPIIPNRSQNERNSRRALFQNLTSIDAQHALHMAIVENDQDSVNCLLERGVNLTELGKDGNSALHLAAKIGDIKRIRPLIESIELENRKDSLKLCNIEGYNVLHVALLESNYDMMKYLLQNGSDATLANRHGDSTMHVAIKHGNIGGMIILLECFGSIDSRREFLRLADKDGRNPLHIALRMRNHEAIKYLLANGVNAADADNVGDSALHVAVKNDMMGEMKLIVDSIHPSEKRSFLDRGDREDDTALHVALLKRNREMVEFLLANDANPSRPNKDKNSALHIVATSGYVVGMRLVLGSVQNLEKKELLGMKNASGLCALHIAFLERNYEIAKYLLECGFDVTECTKDGDTIFQFVAKYGNATGMQLLVNSYAQNEESLSKMLNSYNTRLNTLDMALSRSNSKMVRYLLTKGANVAQRNTDGWSVLHVAAKNGDIPAMHLLGEMINSIDFKNMLKSCVLHVAILARNNDMVQYLLEQGVDVCQQDMEGNSTLHLAVKSQNIRAVELILQSLDSKNQKSPANGNNNSWERLLSMKNSENINALQIAISEGYYDVVKYLLEKGAKKALDDADNNSLYIAAKYGDIDGIKHLLELVPGSNIPDIVKRRNSAGHTAVHIALLKGYYNIVGYLLTKGGDLSAQKEDKNSILHFAVKSGNIHVLKLILESMDPRNEELLNLGDDNMLNETQLILLRKNFEIFEYLKANEVFEVFESIDSNENRFIHLRSGNSSTDAIHQLVKSFQFTDKRALIEAKNFRGNTALHLAVKRGNCKMVKYLLENGADKSQHNARMKSPLDLAKSCQNSDLLQLFQESTDSTKNIT